MTFHPAWLAALAAAALAPCQLAAQTCGLKNHYRIVNSVNNVPSSELRVDSGWQAVGPLASPGSNSGSNPQGCLSQGTCHPVADYGYLSVQGAGSATTCVAGGVFLWLDEWIGGEPKAQFRDTMTVTSNTLAPGTPVQLLWAVKLDGYATTTSSSPSIQPFVDYRVRLYCNWATMVDTQATGTSVGLCNTSVGSSLPIHGQLLATLRENGVLYGLPNTGSYALDLAAGFSVVSLTPGVTLTTCSGAAYDGLLARARPVGVGCGAGRVVGADDGRRSAGSAGGARAGRRRRGVGAVGFVHGAGRSGRVDRVRPARGQRRWRHLEPHPADPVRAGARRHDRHRAGAAAADERTDARPRGAQQRRRAAPRLLTAPHDPR